MHDFIVVGAGIAGLAIAEILQRSGRSVLLLEAKERICGESSAQQQGWFHTGALYAALPSGRSFRQLVGNLDDVLNYYACFPNMNLAAGRYLLTRNQEGWFRNQTSYYFYASPNDPSIRRWQRLPWRLATLRAATRLSWFETVDFTRELSPQIGPLSASLNLSRCVSRRRFDFAPGVVGKVMKSRDRTIDVAMLTCDLLNSFLSHGGELKTGSKVTRIDRGCVSDEATRYRAKYIIVAAGRSSDVLTGVDIRVWKSPLLVVKPAVSDVNFIWMTMNVEHTFNHIHHTTRDAGDYSLIGNALYFSPDDPTDAGEIHAKMTEKTARVFGKDIRPDQTSLFFGYKAELANGSGARNYQYQIIEASDAVLALPGKMSLAFSLAVNVCRHFGVDPVTELHRLQDRGAAEVVFRPEHYRRFAALP